MVSMATITAFFTRLRSQLSSLLGVAQAELQALEPLLAATAAILSSFFPGGGLALYLTNIGTWVKDIETFIITVDGVIMSPAEAKTIGVEVKPADPVATEGEEQLHAAAEPKPYKLTGDEKNTWVLNQAKKVYPNLPDHIHQLAIESHVSKNRGVAA